MSDQSVTCPVMPGIVDTKQAAEYLGLSPVTLTQWRTEDRGPRYVKLERAVRYRLSDLDEWVDQRAHDAGNSVPRPRKRGSRTKGDS